MSEIKTVTHNGQVYQFGKKYFVGNVNRLGMLIRIDELSNYPFIISENGLEFAYSKLYAGDPDMGTITPAPIELINGAAYMFDYRASKDVIGIYSVCTETISSIGDDFISKNCTNIRPMTVESK
jgi:hypothetical protein